MHLRLVDPPRQSEKQGLRWSTQSIPPSSRANQLNERPWELDAQDRMTQCFIQEAGSSWQLLMEMNSTMVLAVRSAPRELPARKQDEKRFGGHVLRRPLHTRLTQLWASSTPCRWSFLTWDHPAQPETCISLPHLHHLVQTQAWVVLLGR